MQVNVVIIVLAISGMVLGIMENELLWHNRSAFGEAKLK
jgi:hypothetical protein